MISKREGKRMKFRPWIFVFWAMSLLIYADGLPDQLPWDMKKGYTDWQHCREYGVDFVGEAKLVRFDPANANEHGIEAVFLFRDVIKGTAGEYVVTIPDTMRNPASVGFDKAAWKQPEQLGPWQWQVGEAYGCLCISNVNYGIRMVDWVVPLDKWGAFKVSVMKERSEFEVFVRGKKEEYRALQEKIDGIWDREDLEEEEQVARIEQIEERRSEIYDQVQAKGALYFISNFDWYNPDQTWP